MNRQEMRGMIEDFVIYQDDMEWGGKWPFIRRQFRHWPDDGLTWEEMHREDDDTDRE